MDDGLVDSRGLARTWLFTPADNPRALASKDALRADARVIDLEDGSGQDDLRSARAAAAHSSRELSVDQDVYVRVHATGPDLEDDIAFSVGERVKGVIVPKVETVQHVIVVDELLQARETAMGVSRRFTIVLLLETPRAILNAEALSRASQRVERLALGAFDLAAILEVDQGSAPIQHARSQLVLVSSAAGLPRPIASPWFDLNDELGLSGYAYRARMDGFGGIFLVHPGQVGAASSAFAPTSDEKAWAQQVLSAAEQHPGGSFSVDGQVIDAPVLRRASKILNDVAADTRGVRSTTN